MASESEYPKVMKHLSTGNESAGLDDTNTLSRGALQTAETDTGIRDESTSSDAIDEPVGSPASSDDTLSLAEAVSTDDPDRPSPIDDAEGSPDEADTVADTSAEYVESYTTSEDADSSEKTPLRAHAAVSSPTADDAPLDDGREAKAATYTPSHAAPKEGEHPSEAEDEQEPRPSPSHAAPKEDDNPAEAEREQEPRPSPSHAAPQEPEPAASSTAESSDPDATVADDSKAQPTEKPHNASNKSTRQPKGRGVSDLTDKAYEKAAGTADPPVYGLEENETEREMRLKREATQQRIRVGIVIAAIAVTGYLIASRPISLMLKRSEGPRTEPVIAKSTQDNADEDASEGSEDNNQTEESVEETPPEEEAPYALGDQLTMDDIYQHVRGHLAFDGGNVSVTMNDVSVEVSGGRVQVSHLTTDVSGVDPTIIAGRAAQRAAALSNDLAGREIRGANDSIAAFSDVVWVVRNGSGDSYLAVTFPVGTAPSTGDGLTVLASSPRYRLSDSLYWALGGTVQQEKGETPMGADGKYIWSTGVLTSSPDQK